MLKVLQGAVCLAIVCLFAVPAAGQWDVYRSNTYGFAMLVPRGAQGVVYEKSGWGGNLWDVNGVKIIGLSKIGNYKNDLIKASAAEISGVPANLWILIDKGAKVNGWSWYELYGASDGTTAVFCVVGQGPNRMHILYIFTTVADFQANRAAYDTWYKSLTVFQAGSTTVAQSQTATTPVQQQAATTPAQTPAATAPAPQTIALHAEQTLEYPKYNRPWGWFNTHTYDLGKDIAIATISGKTIAGPSEQKGKKFSWQVRVSTDKTTWTTVGAIEAIGATESVFGPVTVNRTARYVQIFANGAGFVDFSDLTIIRQ